MVPVSVVDLGLNAARVAWVPPESPAKVPRVAGILAAARRHARLVEPALYCAARDLLRESGYGYSETVDAWLCWMTRRKSSKANAEIDRNLKRAFDALADEPLPERFTALLDKLKAGDMDGSESADPDAEDLP